MSSLLGALHNHSYLTGWYNQSYRPIAEAKGAPDDKPPDKSGKLEP
ncbi:MAG: hypothetical protein LBJ61_10170 [Deltaproteobacteria bacterium]|nr:hypothetical protein [Deltaproteobacteria bacterium]